MTLTVTDSQYGRLSERQLVSEFVRLLQILLIDSYGH